MEMYLIIFSILAVAALVYTTTDLLKNAKRIRLAYEKVRKG